MPIERCYVMVRDNDRYVTKSEIERDALITYGWTLMANAMETEEGNGN